MPNRTMFNVGGMINMIDQPSIPPYLVKFLNEERPDA